MARPYKFKLTEDEVREMDAVEQLRCAHIYCLRGDQEGLDWFLGVATERAFVEEHGNLHIVKKKVTKKERKAKLSALIAERDWAGVWEMEKAGAKISQSQKMKNYRYWKTRRGY